MYVGGGDFPGVCTHSSEPTAGGGIYLSMLPAICFLVFHSTRFDFLALILAGFFQLFGMHLGSVDLTSRAINLLLWCIRQLSTSCEAAISHDLMHHALATRAHATAQPQATIPKDPKRGEFGRSAQEPCQYVLTYVKSVQNYPVWAVKC